MTLKNNKQASKGFTLVEIIVVLIIIGILATLAVPALTNYMEKVDGNAILIEAETVYSAAQSACSEIYAKYGELPVRFRAVAGGPSIRGRVTSWMLTQAQKGISQDDSTKINDYRIAKAVLKSLESYNVTKPRYKFNSAYNGLNYNVTLYEQRYHQPLVIISYDTKGVVDFIEFGYNGYLAHVSEGTKWFKKNGTSSKYPDT